MMEKAGKSAAQDLSGRIAIVTGGGTGLGLELALTMARRGAADRLCPSQELEERVRRSIPLGRFATRKEVAAAATWLLSDDAAYVTGECLTVDGGGWLGRGVLGADEPIPKVRRRRR